MNDTHHWYPKLWHAWDMGRYRCHDLVSEILREMHAEMAKDTPLEGKIGVAPLDSTGSRG